MRSSTMTPALSSLLLLLNFVPTVIATPLATALPLDALQILEGNALEKRCENPCGSGDWLCCGSGATCYTNSADQAACSTAGSGWEYYTTTYVVTEVDRSTVVSVWSSQVTATATAATATATCDAGLAQTTCGTNCCSADEECVDGECVLESSSAAVTGDATPAARGTSSGWSTATATAAATTTEGFIAPVSTDGSDLIGAKATSNGGGLSGGAIAGIVIGTIAGVILLFLLCACFCFKEALYGLLAALGCGKRRKKQETIIDERYSHHSHGSRPRPQGGRTWFGTKPAASEVSEKKSSWSGWGTVAVILGALALCLGLKRHRDREHDDDRTESSYPSSYSYYYSDYTRSSDSSGGRTRDTRRSRRSRTRSRR
ncbi:uncharacterized protein N7484_011391 [Penicillium longicatenatum]|uniref:uncharacterized protein n=1 Tax=Penicillium longicatenatum TaxID=1561947 RepID=UPI002547DBB8|nr:uncharacterized protein N7484_011391 [Penicillium longicatenatum]KAJ5631291.1 hypothetical protein N7484_011391 [Penicillium longicatenatum]